MSPARCERRARRLVALYPRGWRARFGEEFEQLLIDEMHARGHSARRTGDVVAHAILARLVVAGVVGQPAPPRRRASLALRGLAGAGTSFVVIGVGLWSEPRVGWQWAAPIAPSTHTGMLVMSGALLALCALSALGLAAVGWTVVRRRGAGVDLRWLLVSVGGAAAFWLACRHIGEGWPGTGGHHGSVGSGIARLAWAATLWMTAYWAHPRALGAFPAVEIGWMALSPLLAAIVGVGAVRATRGLVLSLGALRWLSALGAVGILAATSFVAGAAEWVLGSDAGPRGLFEAGRLDAIGLGLLAVALLVGGQAARRALGAVLAGGPGPDLGPGPGRGLGSG